MLQRGRQCLNRQEADTIHPLKSLAVGFGQIRQYRTQEQHNIGLPAVLLQHAGNHQRIAAVIAFAAHQEGAAGYGKPAQQIGSGGLPGVFHQLQKAGAGIHRGLFALAHLGGGVDFRGTLRHGVLLCWGGQNSMPFSATRLPEDFQVACLACNPNAILMPMLLRHALQMAWIHRVRFHPVLFHRIEDGSAFLVLREVAHIFAQQCQGFAAFVLR